MLTIVGLGKGIEIYSEIFNFCMRCRYVVKLRHIENGKNEGLFL